MKIAVLVPTRGRPGGLSRFIQSFKKTTKDADMFLSFQEDDNRLCDYEAMADFYKIPYIVQGNVGIGNKLNKLHKNNPGYDVYTLGSDDIEFLTEGWDDIIRDRVKQFEEIYGHRICIFYGHDGIQGENKATHPYITKEFLAITGEFYPSGYMRHLYLDDATMCLAQSISSLVYVPEITMNHYHFINKMSAYDANYQETNCNEAYTRDLAAFKKWGKEKGRETAIKLGEAIK